MNTSAFSTGHYLILKVGAEHFAIDVFQVREVLDVIPMTRIPSSPPYLRGVVNVRGAAIPVVDLRSEFGLQPANDTFHARIVVLEIRLDGRLCVIGAQADGVHEVVEIDAAQVEPAPRFAARWTASISKGLARRGPDFVIVLDVVAIFTRMTAGGARTGETAREGDANGLPVPREQIEQLLLGPHAQLGEDASQMIAHRVLADEERPCDGRRTSVREQPVEDVVLARGQ